MIILTMMLMDNEHKGLKKAGCYGLLCTWLSRRRRSSGEQ